MTTDMEAAGAFYSKVVGWDTRDASTPGLPYALFIVDETSVGGLLILPEDARKMGVGPHWIGYVAVDDVDATAVRMKQLGGAVHVPPQNIHDISRFSVVADPQKATLALVQWLKPRGEQSVALGELGRVSWHELVAADWEKALAFYSDLFGWQKAEADIGPLGTYQLFSVGGQVIGAMFTKPATVPVPFWHFYFNIGDIDAATARVKAGGGQVLEGPIEVGAGSWIARCVDPQGAMFALAGKRSSKAIGYFERVAPRDPSNPQGRRWSW